MGDLESYEAALEAIQGSEPMRVGPGPMSSRHAARQFLNCATDDVIFVPVHGTAKQMLHDVGTLSVDDAFKSGIEAVSTGFPALYLRLFGSKYM